MGAMMVGLACVAVVLRLLVSRRPSLPVSPEAVPIP